MKLYGHTNKRSFNTLKIRLALAEAGASYEYVPVDLDAGENKRPEFLRVNPHGKIPVLVDGEFALPESNAILWYVGERFPDARLLLPADGGATPAQARARTLQWIEFAASMYSYYTDYWNYALGDEEQRKPALAEAALGRMSRSVGVLETVLATREWVAGASYSLADAANVSILFALKRKLPADPTTAAPHVKAWYDRATARPSWKSVIG
jgi:glutathione S-transferase